MSQEVHAPLLGNSGTPPQGCSAAVSSNPSIPRKWLCASAVTALALACAFYWGPSQLVPTTTVMPNNPELIEFSATQPHQSGQIMVPHSNERNHLSMHLAMLRLVQLAGLGQLALCVISVAIPYILDWEGQFANMGLLLKQEFYVYAGYIWSINLSFGLLSFLAAESLLEKGFLPAVVAAFIFAYWAARVGVQCFVFDLTHMSKPYEVVGRRGIEMLFVYLTLVYSLVMFHNFGAFSLEQNIPEVGPIGRMLIIIVGVFLVMKVLVSSVGDGPHMTWLSTLIFMFVWPGMRTSSFLGKQSFEGSWWKDLAWGMCFLVLGFMWCVGVKTAHEAGWSDSTAGLIALPGLSMIGHFGVLRLLRACLRLIGYEVEQLFVDPLLADSLRDFWGKRWNVAFSDMNRAVIVAFVRSGLTDLKVSQPVVSNLAKFAGFFASALLHEAGISLPVLSGYGGPSCYFVLQGFMVFVETRPSITDWQARHPIMSRILVVVAIIVPLPVCFVERFRTNIALPAALSAASLLAFLR